MKTRGAMEAGLPDVYFGGLIIVLGNMVPGGRQMKFVLYRLDSSVLKQKEEKVVEISRINLSPDVEMNYGFDGCCTMIGDDIYWFGENASERTMNLFKHGINDGHPLSWKILSSTTGLFSPHAPNFIAPFGRKLYVFRGTGNDEDLDRLKIWGAVYDLDSNTWETLTCNIRTRRGAYCAPYVALTENKQELLFYSLRDGSILFLNLTNGEWRQEKKHGGLALWDPRVVPVGLEGLELCWGMDTLIRASRDGPALLCDNTLYWFTGDLLLYGYDIKLRRWFQSPYLGEQLPMVTPCSPGDEDDVFPFLVDLRNGKFMLIVSEGYGQLTVAPLTVVKTEDYLGVTVDTFYPLSVGDTSFFPLPEFSMMKKTCSGSIPGPSSSAREP